jgi:hypothetical protein
MFDNLREASGQSDLYEEQGGSVDKGSVRAPARRLFGMTAGQRLVISILLMATVVIMGLMCLAITGKVYL